MISGFLQGMKYAFSGFSLITKKGIRPFVLIPLVINIAVFSVAIWLASSQFEALMNYLTGWLPSWMPDFIKTGLEWLLWPLFAILILIAVYYTFTIIANLIAAPFNSILAERVEQQLKGQPITEQKGFKAMMKTLGKTMGSEVSKVLYMLKWVPLLLLISVIPVVNVISPFAWGIYGAWMLSLQYTDFAMGNHQLFIKEELPLLRKNRSMALGFGGVLTVLMMIPIVNFIVMPVGVAGGTRYWVESLSKQ
ncbi:sulfate transporter CysZ [Cocleimonas sp. KMM 6892]|uniref:sulfate transporter CysZ n=1 Tax=unclassified Cocleimonas TaxID=2639732 RepID=UPI002DBE0196|nr:MULTISPECIES: sulfate transporter CysZ [unclassified Cocleimonas]MEB8432212.1 sulfate transporter CysZ [Cocleimonas sp. KMM 6892]MEC4714702.1 sulfate transporter CysZ [Cocleimonas sp. KMM 6895]MEC4744484.1 sulfate transporter CysZ [Cocleimonas sp. KMM 6896]